MSALDVLSQLAETHLLDADLKYCLVTESKRPYKLDDTPARPNAVEDFVTFSELLQHDNLSSYAGVGISIQASNVFAIDVDHCFAVPFDLASADDRANDVLERFVDYAYCEFSFSGTGLRVLFKTDLIEDYSVKYYIKNEKYKIEFYQPSKSYRYVTVTGRTISDNPIVNSSEITPIMLDFLNTYMIRPVRKSSKTIDVVEETRTIEELKKLVKVLYFKNKEFQDAWFATAPGSGKDESEKDYHLIALLFEKVTQDKQLIKELFESSYYFKTKDAKHVFKWNNQDFRYYNYVYDIIRRTKT